MKIWTWINRFIWLVSMDVVWHNVENPKGVSHWNQFVWIGVLVVGACNFTVDVIGWLGRRKKAT